VTHSFRFDIAIIAWLGFPRPFRSRWDREFESALLQRRVTNELSGGQARLCILSTEMSPPCGEDTL
jgi:hypothetical protein